MHQHKLFLPLSCPGAVRDKDVTHRPPPWEGVPRLAAVPWRPRHATGHQIGGIKEENFPPAHGSAPSPLAPPRRPAFGVCAPAPPVPPRHRLSPCQISVGSGGDGITTKRRDFKRVPACFLFSPSSTARCGAGREASPRSPPCLGGRATQGGANLPASYRPQGRRLSQIWLLGAVPPLCLYFSSPGQGFHRALRYRRSAGRGKAGFRRGMLASPHPFRAPLRFFPAICRDGKPWLGRGRISWLLPWFEARI